jgi:hypothetical protein
MLHSHRNPAEFLDVNQLRITARSTEPLHGCAILQPYSLRLNKACTPLAHFIFLAQTYCVRFMTFVYFLILFSNTLSARVGFTNLAYYNAKTALAGEFLDCNYGTTEG